MRHWHCLPGLWIVVYLSACKALQPSADMGHFQQYFADCNEAAPGNQLKVTFFGTSTLLFDDGTSQILIDGFFTRPKGSKVVFGKVKSDTALIRQVISAHHITRLKGIFVCHSHYDHVMDAPFVAQATGATVYGSSSTAQVSRGALLPPAQMHIVQANETITLGKFSIKILDSKHTPPFKILGRSNATDPQHPNIDAPLYQPAKADAFIEGGTYDFYITHANKHYMVKASTNYIEGALNPYPTDVFFLGAAMLGKMSDSFCDTYFKETVTATGASTVIPIHWDNFTRPLSEPLSALPNIGDNVEKGLSYLTTTCKKNGIKVHLMQQGCSVVY